MKREPLLTEGWLYYDLNVNPEPWSVGPVQVSRKSGKLVPFIGRNAQLHNYQSALKEQLADWNTLLLPGLYWSRHYFWRSRDRYVTEKGRTVTKNEVDLTNMVKAAEDACQGVLFSNDVKCVSHSNFVMAQGVDIGYRVIVAVHPVTSHPSLADVLPSEVVREFKIT